VTLSGTRANDWKIRSSSEMAARIFGSRPNLAATGWGVEADDQAGNPVNVQAFVVCAAP
jgi:hypothetical protein